MASANLKDELLCSVCLSIYTEPVMLRCGHNFCRVCINQVLNTQDGSAVYSCPECREEFHKRPGLIRNITLCNVVENFLSTQSKPEVTRIFCTYCIHSPVPAVKSCLMCEASLCDNHLRVHSEAAEHVLVEPSTSLKNRKCSVHEEILKFYCVQDAICICASCGLIGKHTGHIIEPLDQASAKKKDKMKHFLQKMTEETDERMNSLQEHWVKVQDKAVGETERVTALFIDIRRRLDDLEKRVLSEISRQEEQVSLSVSDLIQQLEKKKDELSRKMRHIEELCNLTDPLTFLQGPDTGDLCDPEEGGGDEDTGGHDKTHDVDVDVITGMLHAGFSDIITYLQTISPANPEEMSPHLHGAAAVLNIKNNDIQEKIESVAQNIEPAGKQGICVWDHANIFWDVNTASNYFHISDNLKYASYSKISQNRPETAVRFQCPQVMSSRRFFSGRHYWDVEINESDWWRVGMCYPSIDRREGEPVIGNNNKSWALWKRGLHFIQYSVIHDNKDIRLPYQICGNRFRICLDYEAGQLSFYELCDPIRHLHTFTATFTEPLHSALCLGSYGSIKILGAFSNCEKVS